MVPADRDLFLENTSLGHSTNCLLFASSNSLKRTPFRQNARREARPEDFRAQPGPLALCGCKKTFHPELIRPEQRYMSGERQ